jgi:hypothetical protein
MVISDIIGNKNKRAKNGGMKAGFKNEYLL